MIDIRCPACWKDDQVQKATAILTQGTGTVTQRVPYAFDSKWGLVFSMPMQAPTQTNLAESFTPPKPPSAPKHWSIPTAIAVAQICSLCLLCSLPHATLPTILSGLLALSILWCAICIPCLLIEYRVTRPKRLRVYRQAYQQWEQDMQNWHRLYYCHRCDYRFVV